MFVGPEERPLPATVGKGQDVAGPATLGQEFFDKTHADGKAHGHRRPAGPTRVVGGHDAFAQIKGVGDHAATMHH